VTPPATTLRTPGPRPPLDADAACRLVSAAQARAAILVEGWSDQAALEALARRRGRDLPAEGILVVPIGGATNVQRFVQALGPRGLGVRLAGLCDVAELPHVRRGLERAGAAARTDASTDTEHNGFYACDADLEDELIRALGTAAVQRVLDTEGELVSFRRFRPSPRNAAATFTHSCAAFSALAPDARCVTARCSWTRSTSTACRLRSTAR
jgi:hypothetical protein